MTQCDSRDIEAVRRDWEQVRRDWEQVGRDMHAAHDELASFLLFAPNEVIREEAARRRARWERRQWWRTMWTWLNPRRWLA